MDTDYWHSLDRKSAQDVGISPDFISISTHPFKEQLDELKAKIFSFAQYSIHFCSSVLGSYLSGIAGITVIWFKRFMAVSSLPSQKVANIKNVFYNNTFLS